MSFNRNGLRAKLAFATGKRLSQEQLGFARQQFNLNARALEESGYTVEDKLADLRDPAARFLFASLDDGQEVRLDSKKPPLVALFHFRFTVQGELLERMEGEPVLLVADAFVARESQHKGLGRHCMALLELVARKETMSGLMFASYQALDSAVEPFISSKLKGWALDEAWEPEDGAFTVYAKTFAAPPAAKESGAGGSPTSMLATDAAVEKPVQSEVDLLATNLAATPFWESVPQASAPTEAKESVVSEEDAEEDDVETARLLDELVALFVKEHAREPTEEEVAQWRETLASASLLPQP